MGGALPAIDVVVFDMDGVLVDVSESYRAAISRTVEHFTGVAPTPAAIQDLKNDGGWNNDWALAQELIRRHGLEVSYGRVVDYFQSVFFPKEGGGLILRERWMAAPGLLESFCARRRLAVFTGRPRDEARFTLRRFAAENFFEPVVAHEDVSAGKPSPEGLALIARQHGTSRLCYVGDTVDDARCAAAAGAVFFGIASPAGPGAGDLRRLLAAAGALAVVDDINQLREWLA